MANKEKDSLDNLLDEYSTLQKASFELEEKLKNSQSSSQLWFTMALEYRTQLDGIRRILDLNQDAKQLEDPEMINFRRKMSEAINSVEGE